LSVRRKGQSRVARGPSRRRQPPGRWAVVASRFNETVVDRLIEGTLACLEAHGLAASQVHVVRVPGAFEIPQLVARMTGWPRPAIGPVPAGVVALGAIVRGQTPHFDYLCGAVTRALMDIALHSGVPLGFGLLTCDTTAQALARAGGDQGNKGYEAAAAALAVAGTWKHGPRAARGGTAEPLEWA